MIGTFKPKKITRDTDGSYIRDDYSKKHTIILSSRRRHTEMVKFIIGKYSHIKMTILPNRLSAILIIIQNLFITETRLDYIFRTPKDLHSQKHF